MIPSVLTMSYVTKISTRLTINIFSSVNKLDKFFSFQSVLHSHYCTPLVLNDRGALNTLSTNQQRFLCNHVQKTAETCNVEETKEIKTFSSLETSLFEEINYESITNGDPELTKKLKIILAEIYVMYEEGKEIPSKVLPEHMKELLKLKSRSGRFQHLRYLFITEKRKEMDLAKKAIKQTEREAFLKQRSENPTEAVEDRVEYGLQSNAILLRIYDSSMDKFDNFRLFQSKIFGPQLILDFGYNSYMNFQENNLCAKQIMQGFGENRRHNFPVHLSFCNYDKEQPAPKKLLKYMPVMFEPYFPFEWHSESYLDLYPKENLVYLTPHCKEELETVSGDDIYIIGAIVDKTAEEPLSLGKAKKEGIRMAKFPFDRYLDWGSGKKNLTINQSIMIMVDMLWKQDWMFAFDRWVPKRKLMPKDHVSYARKDLKRMRRIQDSFDSDNKQKYRSGSLKASVNLLNLLNKHETSKNEYNSIKTKLPPRRCNKSS